VAKEGLPLLLLLPPLLEEGGAFLDLSIWIEEKRRKKSTCEWIESKDNINKASEVVLSPSSPFKLDNNNNTGQ
jgi:hypothetical protein